MDRHRVRAGVRVAAAGGRPPGGPARPSAGAVRRPGPVRDRVAGLRTRAVADHADHRPAGAGRGRGDGLPGRAVAADDDQRRRGRAPPGAGDLAGHHRGGRDRRDRGRRAAHRVLRLAGGVPDQPADHRHHARAGPAAAGREAVRQRRQRRCARGAAGDHRHRGADLRAQQRAAAGLHRGRHHHRARPGCAADHRLCVRRKAVGGPDAAPVDPGGARPGGPRSRRCC